MALLRHGLKHVSPLGVALSGGAAWSASPSLCLGDAWAIWIHSRREGFRASLSAVGPRQHLVIEFDFAEKSRDGKRDTGLHTDPKT